MPDEQPEGSSPIRLDPGLLTLIAVEGAYAQCPPLDERPTDAFLDRLIESMGIPQRLLSQEAPGFVTGLAGEVRAWTPE